MADPPERESQPGGDLAATLVASGPSTSEGAADSDARASGEMMRAETVPAAATSHVKQAAPKVEEFERGWTGLGLPAYEETPAPAPAKIEPKVVLAAEPPKVEARAESEAPKVTPLEEGHPAKVDASAKDAPAAKVEAPKVDAPVRAESAAVAKIEAATRGESPVRVEIAAAAKDEDPDEGWDDEPAKDAGAGRQVKAPAVAVRAQGGGSRPTGKSGAFAAVRPSAAPARASTPGAAAAPAPRPVAAPATPPRLTPAGPAAAPRPVAPRLSPVAPAPKPVAAAAPAPPPGPVPASANGAVVAASAAPVPAPAPAAAIEHDVTVDDEGELGATIPDDGPLFADLSATVPDLPTATHAPSFGLPPPLPAAGAPAVAAPGRAGILPEEPETGPPPYGPGAIISDKYRLIRVIGRGGMGAVWTAHNSGLDVEVALKLMRRDRATPEAAARFTNEARAAARLGHPSIVRVFDFGETSRGDPYIVMELLHGESFGALLARKKKLSPTVAVQTLLPVAHALAAAHAKGIVHRDLKPDNILLAKDESNVVTPKVVDFGIAKLVSSDVDRHFTIAGEVLGSPDYMSPEQARGEDDIDHRTDIWTFSVLLYEAVAGKRPFDGANYNALLAAIIASKPLPIMDLGVAEPGLWAIIEKGLSKERDGRWQSVRELGMELARWAIERGAEHDLAGASLSAQWLEPTRRRLFTVAGSTPPDAEPVSPTEPQIPKPPPLGGLAAEVPKPAAPATSNTMPPFVPKRRPWIAVVVGVLALAAIAGGLLLGGVFEARPDAPAPGSSRMDAVPPPSAVLTESPVVEPATAATAAPTASAKATGSARTKGTAGPLGRPKAPQVKGDIKF